MEKGILNYDTAEGIRRSSLWAIAKSPYHFKYEEENRKEETADLSFGIAAHKYILEKNDFWNEYALAPEVNKRTKVGKETWEAFTLQCAANNKIPIDPASLRQIEEMDRAIDSFPLARELLTGIHEEPFFWTDEKTGEKCKCKPDCRTVYDDKPIIVDYKTTRSCEDGHFERSVRDYGYKLQAGMYCEGVFVNTFEEHGFAFVAQEKSAPYAVRVYICAPEFIYEGQDMFHDLLTIYHDCKESGKWYGYEGPFGLPSTLEGEYYRGD